MLWSRAVASPGCLQRRPMVVDSSQKKGRKALMLLAMFQLVVSCAPHMTLPSQLCSHSSAPTPLLSQLCLNCTSLTALLSQPCSHCTALTAPLLQLCYPKSALTTSCSNRTRGRREIICWHQLIMLLLCSLHLLLLPSVFTTAQYGPKPKTEIQIQAPIFERTLNSVVTWYI